MTKYVMSEKQEDLENALEKVLEFFTTKKLHKNNEMKYPLSFHSPLIHVPTISLFDDSLLMEKYPNGVVTENFVLIPSDKFKQLHEKSTTNLPMQRDGTTRVKTDPEKYKVLLNEFMLAFVEMSLNIEITPEEKSQIHKDIKSGFIDNTIINSPEKVTNRELLKVIEGKEYAFESNLRNALDLSVDVKEILKENQTYIKNIDSIKQKIQEVSIEKINANVTVEEFNDLLDKSFNNMSSPVLPLKIVNQKINDVLQQTEPSIEKFILESEKQVFPYLSKLPPLQFKSSMELIFKEAFGGMERDLTRFSHVNINEEKKDFALSLVKDLDYTQRAYLINMITGVDALSKDFISESNSEVKSGYKIK